MNLHFFKYQGTGNDFILIDNRNNAITLTAEQISQLCDRRFGIGADGLMTLNDNDDFDFEMKYYNADGKEGSMCGNGGRCIVKFANHLGIRRALYHFIAADGEHEAEIDISGIVSLKMKDVPKISKYHNDFVLDTGSPHYVKLVSNVMGLDVYKKGHEIRNSKDFKEKGINVNFVEQDINNDKITVRTFERGVENETYSCGTGVTASALVCHHHEIGFNEVEVKTLGGKLTVEFDKTEDNQYYNIWLCGPAEKVFEGDVTID
ncbi:MAG: diaminopimelate epimerase [Chitinophagaceae bacterium]|nr:diaminopimelate epimerase [Chitinophagaceae bacterium]